MPSPPAQLDMLDGVPAREKSSPVAVEKKRLNAAARRVLAFLRANVSATNVELLHVGGMRFGARLKELRDDGWRIDTEPRESGLFRYHFRGMK